MPSEYEKAHAAYREAAKAAASGDPKAKQDKAAIMNDIRKIERESARAGTVLSAIYKGDKIVTESKSTSSKKSLQEEYVRKFERAAGPDGSEPVVKLGGEETTLSAYHRKRLLGK